MLLVSIEAFEEIKKKVISHERDKRAAKTYYYWGYERQATTEPGTCNVHLFFVFVTSMATIKEKHFRERCALYFQLRHNETPETPETSAIITMQNFGKY